MSDRRSFYDPEHDRRPETSRARDCDCDSCTLARLGLLAHGGQEGPHQFNYALLSEVFGATLAYINLAVVRARALSATALNDLAEAQEGGSVLAEHQAERQSDDVARAHGRMIAFRDELALAADTLEQAAQSDLQPIQSEEELDLLIGQLLGRPKP